MPKSGSTSKSESTPKSESPWGFAPTLVAAAIPAILDFIRGNEVEENPTLALMEERFRREREESDRRIQRFQDEANQARSHSERLQREQADLVNKTRLEIQKFQDEANQARVHVDQLRRENQEQADIARRAKLDAENAAKVVSKLQDQAKQKDEELKNIQAAREEIEARWKKGIRPVEWPSQEQYEKIKQQYYKEGKFHLAIAGISGTGKSTLINAFRGIWDGEENAAGTDVVESTSVVTAYPDPNPSNPFLWFDVPGSGTLSCSDWTYFNNQGLFIFDAIIVLFNDRFTATDAAILKNAERYNIPTYIVRSKSDIHIENLVKKTRRVPGARRDPAKVLDDARKEYMKKTRDSVRTNLMKNDPPLRSQKMYAVSRDTLTLMIREEPLEDNVVLDEYELWKDILQDAFSRRSEKSYGSMTELMKKAGSGLLGLFS
ncbi:interferon-inducible GTPase-domain-containing protein [Desarmillaria tabescens]|uniref:Interferon-inducible GTPase-domain-containing protein n=1 Tax=Armillaria tabescens TaxID=1929756 RepID=A0AA39NBB1_ARMTA|nr:interferon-inducible GTPase-domain-containing protein [Desarmillaria tabescens]KAK0462470.1 interferon-inducible GTPase-domain-containing protein [Desarmillaria tabescens]